MLISGVASRQHTSFGGILSPKLCSVLGLQPWAGCGDTDDTRTKRQVQAPVQGEPGHLLSELLRQDSQDHRAQHHRGPNTDERPM